MTRTANVLAFFATLAACLAGAFSASWWMALGLAAVAVPGAYAYHRVAVVRATDERAHDLADGKASTLTSGAFDLATGLMIGYALGRVAAYVVGG